MSRWRGGGIAGVLVLALGCSGSSTLNQQQLASERRRVHSLDAEAGLFEQVYGTRQATRTYGRGHAAYLLHAARDLVQELSHTRPAAGAEAEFQQVQADATRLEERFVGLLLRIQ
jgi:hypothetical protein